MAEYTSQTRPRASSVVDIYNQSITSAFNAHGAAGDFEKIVVGYASPQDNVGDSDAAEKAYIKKYDGDLSTAAANGADVQSNRILSGAAAQKEATVRVEKKLKKDRENVAFMQRLQNEIKAIRERIAQLQEDIAKRQEDIDAREREYAGRNKYNDHLDQMYRDVYAGKDIDVDNANERHKEVFNKELTEDDKEILSGDDLDAKGKLINDIKKQNTKRQQDIKVLNKQDRSLNNRDRNKVEAAQKKLNELEAFKNAEIQKITSNNATKNALKNKFNPTANIMNEYKNSGAEIDELNTEISSVIPQENALAVFKTNAQALTSVDIDVAQENTPPKVENDFTNRPT